MRQVIFYQLDDGVDDGGLDAGALEKSTGDRPAGGFVAPGGPAFLFAVTRPELSGHGLGEVVREGGEEQNSAIVRV